MLGKMLLGRGVLVISTLGISTPGWAEYLAYAVVNEQKVALPESLDDLDAKHLVNVEWGAGSGNKVRVGVLPVQNNSSVAGIQMEYNGVSYSMPSTGNGVPVQGIEAIVTTVMSKTGRFQLLERSVLDKALKEQDLVSQGRISKPSGARTGKVLGAQYLVQAVVTNYEQGIEKSNLGGIAGAFIPGLGGALLGGLSSQSSKGVVGMNFRVIDAQSSEVRFTHQVEVAMEESDLTFGGLGLGAGAGLGGFVSNYSKTPIGQAVIAAVNKGIYEVVKEIGVQPLRGSIVKVKGKQVYLNLGKSAVKPGDRFQVVSLGEQFIDPDTGLSLGGEEEITAHIQITSVKAKYSIGRINSATGKIKRGDKIVSESQPANLTFASSWLPPKPAKGEGVSGFLESIGNNSGDKPVNQDDDENGFGL